MSLSEPSGPDLAGVVADANAAGLSHVVIGGFAVIAHAYVRATKDTDLLVPDGPDADAAILRFLERTDAVRLSDGHVLAAEDVTGVEHLPEWLTHLIGDRGPDDRIDPASAHAPRKRQGRAERVAIRFERQ